VLAGVDRLFDQFDDVERAVAVRHIQARFGEAGPAA
jgi:hypothetical protein